MKSLKCASRTALIVSLAVFAGAGVASAQSADRLAQADSDGDGNITQQELIDLRTSAFGRLDRNDDGFIDDEDRPRFGPAKSRFDEVVGEFSASADADGDGRVSKAEMLDAPAPMFESGDTDADGVLSAAEIEALRVANQAG